MTTHYSPTPWTYEYNPYTLQRGDEAAEELPAFEVFDAEQDKIFDTNEDMPCGIQEANARLAAAAPKLLAALDRCAILLADYDEQDGEEGDAYRDAIAAITEATAGGASPGSDPDGAPEPCVTAMLEALQLAQRALNTAPRFCVGDTDSYQIASIVDAAIEAATARKEPL